MHIDSRNTEIHTLLSTHAPLPSPPASPLPSPSLTPRYVWPGEIFCGCGYNLDPPSCDAAVADLRSQLGSYSTIYQAYYSIRGPVVAFVCNLNPGFFVTDSDDYGGYIAVVTQQCGRYVAGTYFAFDEGEYGADVGYMQYFAGLDFCGAAEGSSQNSC